MNYRHLLFVWAFFLCQCQPAPTHEKRVEADTENFDRDINMDLGVFDWFIENDEGEETKCVGNKIAPNLLLTAAHCVISKDSAEKARLDPVFEADAIIEYTHLKEEDDERLEKLEVKRVHFPPPLHECLTSEREFDPVCDDDVPVPDVAVIEVSPFGSFAQANELAVDTSPVTESQEIAVLGRKIKRHGKAVELRRNYWREVVATTAEIQEAIKFTTWPDEVDESNFFATLGPLVSINYCNIGSGDSGGGVLRIVTNPDSTMMVSIVGINSYGLCPSGLEQCELTTNNFYSRLDDREIPGIGNWIRGLVSQTTPLSSK
jgi:hypothetical protein